MGDLSRRMKITILSMIVICMAILPAHSANVVRDSYPNLQFNPVTVSPEQALIYVNEEISYSKVEIPEKLEALLENHITEMIEKWPLAPLVVELGITQETVTFSRPSDMILSLSMIYPYIGGSVREKLKSFLFEQVRKLNPVRNSRYSLSQNFTRREPHRLPDFVTKRAGAIAETGGLVSSYALWVYYINTGDREAVNLFWNDMKRNYQTLSKQRWQFKGIPDEVQKLNGYISGLIATVRFARVMNDSETESGALTLLAKMLTERVNYELSNPNIIEQTNQVNNQAPHASKPTRYVDLSPEIGRALLDLCPEIALKNADSLEKRFPAWFLAWGERMIGGENFISPPYFARGVFAAQASILRKNGDHLLKRLDMPWCIGDLWFIEKCAYTFWALGGYAWKSLK